MISPVFAVICAGSAIAALAADPSRPANTTGAELRGMAALEGVIVLDNTAYQKGNPKWVLDLAMPVARMAAIGCAMTAGAMWAMTPCATCAAGITKVANDTAPPGGETEFTATAAH